MKIFIGTKEGDEFHDCFSIYTDERPFDESLVPGCFGYKWKEFELVPVEKEAKSVMDSLEKRFTYHKCDHKQIDDMNHIREMAEKLAVAIEESCVDSKEKDHANYHVDSAVFWANAEISRRLK